MKKKLAKRLIDLNYKIPATLSGKKYSNSIDIPKKNCNYLTVFLFQDEQNR